MRVARLAVRSRTRSVRSPTSHVAPLSRRPQYRSCAVLLLLTWFVLMFDLIAFFLGRSPPQQLTNSE